MPSPSVTYTFSNSTTADASQVNQNFTDLVNGISDGTKDLSISALTCAGNVNLNGNTTIGNATSDTLTLTAYMASGAVPASHNTYDLGLVTTNGWRALFLASSGSTKTVKFVAGNNTSDIILTCPTAVSGTLQIQPVSFSARNSTTAASSSTPFVYTSEDHDTDSAYSTSTGIFTVPTGKGGVYYFGGCAFAGASFQMLLTINGSTVAQGTAGSGGAGSHVFRAVTVAAGDTVELRPNGSVTATTPNDLNYFFGFKIRD